MKNINQNLNLKFEDILSFYYIFRRKNLSYCFAKNRKQFFCLKVLKCFPSLDELIILFYFRKHSL